MHITTEEIITGFGWRSELIGGRRWSGDNRTCENSSASRRICEDCEIMRGTVILVIKINSYLTARWNRDRLFIKSYVLSSQIYVS